MIMGFDSKDRSKVLQFTTYFVVAIAVTALVIQYVSNPSLWRDEAALANNIVERDFTGLFETLSYNQAAPIGFLFLTETITLFFGTSEYSLRLLPLIMGLLSVLFFYLVGQQISRPALILGLALLATSQLHLRYSAEFKQYIGDSFWSLSLLYIALRYIQTDNKSVLPWLAFWGSLSVWFSHPVVFTLAAIGSVLFVRELCRKNDSMLIQLIVIGSLWIVSFTIVYFISYRNVVSGTDLSGVMSNYWNEKFLTLNFTSFVYTVIGIIVWVGGLSQPVMLTFVIFGLVISLLKCRSVLLILLLSPGGFMLVASILELYPIANRMLIFFIPNLMLLASVGWWQVIHSIILVNKRIGVFVFGLLLISLLLRLQLPFTTSDTTEAREALAWIHKVDPDAKLYLTGRFTQISQYYGYEFLEFNPNLKQQMSYWIVTDNPPEPSVIPENKHAIYHFKATTVICVPDTLNECPPQK